MYYILAIWLYGVTIAILPVTFPTHSSCEAAGEAFIKEAKAQPHARTPGYACIPINFDEQSEDKP